jgi:hypothetical protein
VIGVNRARIGQIRARLTTIARFNRQAVFDYGLDYGLGRVLLFIKNNNTAIIATSIVTMSTTIDDGGIASRFLAECIHLLKISKNTMALAQCQWQCQCLQVKFWMAIRAYGGPPLRGSKFDKKNQDQRPTSRYSISLGFKGGVKIGNILFGQKTTRFRLGRVPRGQRAFLRVLFGCES